MEIKQILGTKTKVKSLEIEEIQSMDIKKVVKAKAITAYNIVKKPIIVEDVSFEIAILNKLPGPFIKFFIESIGSAGILKLVNNKSTKVNVIAAIATYDGKQLNYFQGVTKGTLSKVNLGNSGFAFDQIFIPMGYKKTYAQMSSVIKNKISHRAKALIKLKKFLEIN